MHGWSKKQEGMNVFWVSFPNEVPFCSNLSISLPTEIQTLDLRQRTTVGNIHHHILAYWHLFKAKAFTKYLESQVECRQQDLLPSRQLLC